MAMTMTQEKQDSSYAALCSDCHSFIPVDARMRGRWIRCPHCKLQFCVEQIYRRKINE